MSDEESDFEKTQIYLPPGKGEMPRPLPSKTNHEALLKPTREAAARSGVKVDFDITGERPAPKAAPAARPAPSAPAPSTSGSTGLVVVAILLVVAIAGWLLLR